MVLLKNGFKFGAMQRYPNKVMKMRRTGRSIYDQMIFYCMKDQIVSHTQFRKQRNDIHL
jgi:hypothetical protein